MNVRGILQAVRDAIYRAAGNRKTVRRNGIILSLSDPVISNRMYYVLTHQYEAEEIALVDRWVSSEDRVIEAGSAIGFVGLYCILKLGCTHYAMVEANPDLAVVLERNFALNGVDLSSFNLVRAAVTGENGSVEFGLSKNFWSSSTRTRSSTVKRVTVPAISFPTLFSTLGWRPNTLIMDIEGGEVDIPPDHFSLFDKIIIETHSRVVGEDAIEKLMMNFTSLGFDVVAQADTTFVFVRPNELEGPA
jgi:FkbM family methyltransferase